MSGKWVVLFIMISTWFLVIFYSCMLMKWETAITGMIGLTIALGIMFIIDELEKEAAK